jgi:cadmium resistance protein CadD (predicted permease)
MLSQGGAIDNVSSDAQRKDFRDLPILFGFFSWWLSYVPSKIIYIGRKTVLKLFNFFSIDLLLKTLLLPWKRDEQDTTNMSLDQRVQVMIMNLVSILVGASVRAGTIFVGLISMVAAAAATVVCLVGFIAAPAIIILLIFYLPFI